MAVPEMVVVAVGMQVVRMGMGTVATEPVIPHIHTHTDTDTQLRTGGNDLRRTKCQDERTTKSRLHPPRGRHAALVQQRSFALNAGRFLYGHSASRSCALTCVPATLPARPTRLSRSSTRNSLRRCGPSVGCMSADGRDALPTGALTDMNVCMHTAHLTLSAASARECCVLAWPSHTRPRTPRTVRLELALGLAGGGVLGVALALHVGLVSVAHGCGCVWVVRGWEMEDEGGVRE